MKVPPTAKKEDFSKCADFLGTILGSTLRIFTKLGGYRDYEATTMGFAILLLRPESVPGISITNQTSVTVD